MDARMAAVIGHGAEVLLKNFQVDDHAGRRQIFFMEVLEIAPDDPSLDLVVAARRTGGKRRRTGRDTAGGDGTEKTSARSHNEILSQARGNRLGYTSIFHFFSGQPK